MLEESTKQLQAFDKYEQGRRTLRCVSRRVLRRKE